MTSPRNPLFRACLPAMLAGLALLPASASAGSLLSGYGAPGGGAQAIVGSALVNGGSGGGGGGGAGASGTGASAQGTGAASGSGATSSQGGGQGGAGAGSSAAHATHSGHAHAGAPTLAGGSGGGASAGSAPAYTYPGAARMASTGNSGALGFTGTDLLLLFLVLGVLALTAGLTRRLARTPH